MLRKLTFTYSSVFVLLFLTMGFKNPMRQYKSYYDLHKRQLKETVEIAPNGLEEGKYLAYDTLGNIAVIGKVHNGMQVSKWKYLHGGESFKIDWVAYNDSIHKLAVNIPKDFQKRVWDSTSFAATNNDSNNTFNILITKHLTGKTDILNYQEIAIKNAKENYSVANYWRGIAKFKSGKRYYFLVFELNFGSRVYYIHNFMGMLNDKEFVDFSLFYPKDEQEKAEVILKGISQHLYVGGKRFMTPFEDYQMEFLTE